MTSTRIISCIGRGRRFGALSTSDARCVVVAAFVAFSLSAALLSTPMSASAQAGLRPVTSGHWSYSLIRELDAASVSSAWVVRSRPTLGSDLVSALDAGDENAYSRAATAWAGRLSAELGGGDRNALLGISAGGTRNDAIPTEVSAGFGRVVFDLQPSGSLGLWADGVVSSQNGESGLRSGGLSLASDGFHLVVGKVRGYAGGSATPLVLNGNVGFNGVLLGTRQPVSLPGGLERLGRFQFHALVAPGVETPTVESSWFASYGVSWDPIRDLSFGATRTVRFAGTGLAPLTASNLWNMLTAGGGDSDFDDSQGAVSVRARLRLGPARVATYLTLGFEDLVSIKEDPAVLAGFTVPFATDAGLFSLGYEFAGIGQRGRWCDCEYKSHRWYSQREFGPYVANGTFLGSPLGGYGAGHYIQVSFWSTPLPLRVAASVFSETREASNFLASRWPDARKGVRLDVGVGPWQGVISDMGIITSRTDSGAEHGVEFTVRVFDLYGILGGS